MKTCFAVGWIQIPDEGKLQAFQTLLGSKKKIKEVGHVSLAVSYQKNK